MPPLQTSRKTLLQQRLLASPVMSATTPRFRNLWDAAVQGLGSVDIWINNAGRDGMQKLIHELPVEDYTQTVQTNLLGLLHCNRVAINGMLKQGSGKIFNMEGFGSDGNTMPRYAVYGGTKYALRYITKVLVKECKDTCVQMCYISPGMVVTDMLIAPDAPTRSGMATQAQDLQHPC